MKAKMVVGLLFAVLMIVLTPATTKANGTYEGITVTGGNLGTDYTYRVGCLTIVSGKPMTLTGSTSTMGIEINSNATANLTLQDAAIDVRSSLKGAIYLNNGATLNLTVLGNNTLMSYDTRAGIEVSSGTTLVITAASTGTLNVTGGNEGAGIGSSYKTPAGHITIWNGTINATGIKYGAGIGGGNESAGGTIIIRGGTIKATSKFGAGIGGGEYKMGGDIAIHGGVVEAKSTDWGAGIGGGWFGSGGTVTITAGTVKAIGQYGAGIGGGSEGNGGNITISGGTVQASGNYGGAGIGGGLNFGNGGTVKITGGVVFATSWGGGKDIGAGKPSNLGNVLSDGTLEISGTAAMFLVHDTCPPITSAHTHINVTGHTYGASVYGYPVPWAGSFGAYLLLYPLTYNLGGGLANPANPAYYGPECASFTLAYPTKTGYTFTGWTGTEITEPSLSVTISPDMTGGRDYTAHWRPNTYTVNYHANGGTGSTASSSHTYDEAHALTANGFTRIGYTFAGWATSASGAVKYNDGQGVQNVTAEDGAAVTLYAKWTPITYTINYDANGGAGSTASSSHTYDAAKSLTANGFTRTGYTFAGWANSADETVAYSNMQSVSNLSTVKGGTITLYAKWTPNTYTVEYDANGGTGSKAYSDHTYDTEQTLTANGFTRTGYSFSGWATSAQGAAVYPDGHSVSNLTAAAGATVTLYATWIPNTYTVSYDANGGMGSTGSSSHTYDVANTLTANGFTKTGYTFTGWAISTDGAVMYSNEHSVSNLAADNGATVTLYAKWMPNTYTVSYDPNGGVGSTASGEHTYDAAQTLTTNGFTRIGYTFSGWAASADGAVVYMNGQSVSNLAAEDGETVTLFAKWTPHTYTVSYDANGGSGSTVSSNHTYDVEKLLTPNGFKLAGYTFSGWATSTDGAVVYINGQSVLNLTAEDGGTVRLFAVWTTNRETTPTPRGTVVNCTSGVSVRSGPGTNYPLVGFAPKGTTYLLTGQSGAWYKISFDGKVGYISADYFSIPPMVQVPQPALLAPQFGQGTIVNCNNSVNVRSGPGTNYAVIGSAPKGAAYTITGQSGSWYIIEFGGNVGYISADYFSVSSMSPAPQSTPEPGQGMIVNCNHSVNVRSGPGTNYSIIGSAPKGATYTVTEKSGAWYEIEFNGLIAYISAKYFSAGNV